ncbi:MAG: bifunctional 3,4-dihydroxy-2-butanone-4-phosphate synthase/GTP cyclohydrolase II [Planctomycetia bacterium TMED53]|nr:MAG: bifunctional 3,4-dihydroxy-2-butanone-4-phosphate synthase/GTP cyclohydrolase II [Planctomycetia bacterium TMED53]
MPFAKVEELIQEIARGRMVILIDAPDRENEGDLVMAAELVTDEKIKFCALEGRGLICAPMAAEFCDRLDLPPMSDRPTLPGECAFTVSVDASEGISTGISAADRAHTARLLADPNSRPDQFNRPGHLFPLRSKPGGVLRRTGHTEASVDLARMAGLQPAAIICEVMNDDGTMARLPELEKFAEKHGLLLGTIESLVEYRQEREPAVEAEPEVPVKLSSAIIPTPYGNFELDCWKADDGDAVTVLRMGSLTSQEDDDPLIRVHSSCMTGDIFGSLRCDCGMQLDHSLKMIGAKERGAVIYLPQEGRGIGLPKKIEAYHLQDTRGLDTVEANVHLGFGADLREYSAAANILKAMNVKSVRLLTNNPAKVEGLENNGVSVSQRVPLELGIGPINVNYLKTKKSKFGHIFETI